MRKLFLLSLIALSFTACDGPNDSVAAQLGQHVHTGMVFKDLRSGKCIGVDAGGESVTFTVVACPAGIHVQ